MGQNLIVMPSTKARYETEALYGLVGVTTQVRLYRKRVRFSSRMIGNVEGLDMTAPLRRQHLCFNEDQNRKNV